MAEGIVHGLDGCCLWYAVLCQKDSGLAIVCKTLMMMVIKGSTVLDCPCRSTPHPSCTASTCRHRALSMHEGGSCVARPSACGHPVTSSRGAGTVFGARIEPFIPCLSPCGGLCTFLKPLGVRSTAPDSFDAMLPFPALPGQSAVRVKYTEVKLIETRSS